jgi:2-polyprenyl-3-methyl-5-hydroxy-6-metoxy-1,4-benzoquinol methylase
MDSMMAEERIFLDKVASTYRKPNLPITKFVIETYIKVFRPFLKYDSIALELGCSDGYSTDLLSRLVKKLDVVEGSNIMIERAIGIAPSNVQFRHALFEELAEETKYQYIFANYVLEHVIDPIDVLRKCSKLLNKDGLIFITVPNARALSRQLALEMGIISNLYELTQNDLQHGHRRVFDMTALNMLLSKCGFQIICTGGLYVKPFADFQLNKMIESNIIGESQLNAMHKLAYTYPDISGSIYLIAKTNYEK